MTGMRRLLLLWSFVGITTPIAVAVEQGSVLRGRAPVTFAREIGPLLFERCIACHHPDGPAPFSLASYPDVRHRAKLIADVTSNRSMPPWNGETDHGGFVGHHPLNEGEIAMIQEWVADGSPAGDLRDLPPATWATGWRLGQPDMVLSLQEPYVLAEGGGDVWRIFVLPGRLDSPRYVRGLEFRPNSSGIIHHARIRIDRTPASRAVDEQDPAPGYEGAMLRSARYPEGHFLGWTPGQAGPLVSADLAWRLEPGADLVVELHMVPSGKRENVSPSIALYFSERAPTRTPTILRLGRQDLDIAPGVKNYISEDTFVLPVDVEVRAVQPHAHFRATEIRAETLVGDGPPTSLLHIREWDVRWQHFYQFVTPVSLPKGTRVAMRFTFDNSAENLLNPQLPPQRVFWGEESTSEMGELWVQLLTRRPSDQSILNDAVHRKMAAEDVVGFETRLRADPSQVHLHEAAGDTQLYLGKPKEAVVHFRAAVAHRPNAAEAHYNLGTALSEAGELDDAAMSLARAIDLRPDYALARNNLGGVLVRLGRLEGALHHYQEAMRLAPTEAEAYYNAGSVWRALGDQFRAKELIEHAVLLRPNWVIAVSNLAWLLATAPHDELRNPGEAVRLALHAADLTERSNATVMDVLAAAYASAGRFDEAVWVVRRALALKPPIHIAEALHQRQALYTAKKPYRTMPGR